MTQTQEDWVEMVWRKWKDRFSPEQTKHYSELRDLSDKLYDDIFGDR